MIVKDTQTKPCLGGTTQQSAGCTRDGILTWQRQGRKPRLTNGSETRTERRQREEAVRKAVKWSSVTATAGPRGRRSGGTHQVRHARLRPGTEVNEAEQEKRRVDVLNNEENSTVSLKQGALRPDGSFHCPSFSSLAALRRFLSVVTCVSTCPLKHLHLFKVCEDQGAVGASELQGGRETGRSC